VRVAQRYSAAIGRKCVEISVSEARHLEAQLHTIRAVGKAERLPF
jgi:hypothetical protein